MPGIRIIIKDGKRSIEGVGFTGPACERAVMDIVEKLGGKVTERENTSDYYLTPNEEVEQA